MAPGDAGFLALPPLSPGAGAPEPTLRMDGSSWISTWRSPGFMTGMSHLVSPDAPSGVVADLVNPGLPVQRMVSDDLTLRPLPRRAAATGLRGFVQRLLGRPAPSPESAPLDSREPTAPTVVPPLPQAPLPPVLRLPAVPAPVPSPELVRAPQPDLPPRPVAATHPSAEPGREVRLPQLPVIQRHAHAPVQDELPVVEEPMPRRQVDVSMPSSAPTTPTRDSSVASVDFVESVDSADLPVVSQEQATQPLFLQRRLDTSTPSSAPTRSVDSLDVPEAPTLVQRKVDATTPAPTSSVDLPIVSTPAAVATTTSPQERAAQLPLLQRQLDASTQSSALTSSVDSVEVPEALTLVQRQVDATTPAPTHAVSSVDLPIVSTPATVAVTTSPQERAAQPPLLQRQVDTTVPPSASTAPTSSVDLPVVTHPESPDSTTAPPLLQRRIDTTAPPATLMAPTRSVDSVDLPVETHLTAVPSPASKPEGVESPMTALPLIQRQLDTALSPAPSPPKRRGLGAPLSERSLPTTVQRTPAASPVVPPLPLPTPFTEVPVPDLPIQRTIDAPEAPVLPILADRPTAVPERTATPTPAEAPALQVRAIDRPPGRLQQLTPSVQRITTAGQNHQAPLAMPTAPVPAINPLSSAPAPQHRATQLVAPATPVVVQRTAAPEVTNDQADSTFVQLAEVEPTPPPTTNAPPASTPSTPSTTTDIDGLARRLYDPIARRLRAELRVDRERAGTLVDRPW